MSTKQAARKYYWGWGSTSKYQAHRKKVQDWLRAHPRVKLRAEHFLELIYASHCNEQEVQEAIHCTLNCLDSYLRYRPKMKVTHWFDLIRPIWPDLSGWESKR